MDERTELQLQPVRRLGDVGKQGWNILRGDTLLPVLTLRDNVVGAVVDSVSDVSALTPAAIRPAPRCAPVRRSSAAIF